MSNRVVFIVGPTASGKSSLAMEVARRFNGEIICADSRTVYRDMDIGTAKPTTEDQRSIRHHVLDVVNPGEYFSAAEFKRMAVLAIEDVSSRRKLPIVVGGTGLYIDALLFDYSFGAKAEKSYRDELVKRSVVDLQNICRDKNIDLPINEKNKRHLVRAIELGGCIRQEKVMKDEHLVVGISTDREKLRDRIIARTEEMFAAGVVNEARLIGEKYGWDSEAAKGNVYPILRDFIDNKISRSEAIELIVRSDMRLAKRQMTWFRRNSNIHWSESANELITKIDQFLLQ